MWKFLHIACMVGAVAVLAGGGAFRNAVLRIGSVESIRAALAAERRLSNAVGAPLLLAGVAFGFVTAVTTGFNLAAPWLVTAYVLLALNVANGVVLYEPHAKRLQAAADASGDDEPSDELAALIGSPRTRVLNAVDAALWLAIVFVMVAKAFS
jgi:hypothetical protein